MQKICGYTILLISFFLLFAANQLQAQSKKDKKNYPIAKWWNGFSVHADVASIVTSAINYKETYSFEGSVQCDLKHRFFPVLELGYAGADKTSKTDIGFKTNGAFGRIGLDFNLTKQKVEKPTSNLFLFGVRLGMTNASYTLSNITITDGYWGGNETLPSYSQRPAQYWYELVLGVKVLVTKNIFMGWSVRNKSLFGADDTSKMQPWYVPGYGKTGSNWGANYTIGYKF